nr:MAG TPA: hypothetical protein [Caudoviricetes sp.]
MSLFTPAELEELRRADEAIERGFRWTNEELAESRERDRESVLDQMDGKSRRLAERQKAYREANREKVAERWKGAALRRLRKLAGYSQKELSRRSGVSQPTISLYETGAVPFDPSIFEPVLPGLSASLEDGPTIPDKEVDT